YGARKGKPTERNLVGAALEAIDLLKEKTILLGESLGTGVACEAAARRQDTVGGLVLVAPFDSLVSVAGKHYPLIPAGLILQDRYQSSQALRQFDGPVAIIMAEKDSIIPPESTQRLFRSYHGPKQLWRIPQSGHNEVLWDISDSELLSAFAFAAGD